MSEQVLDSMDLERERGITIKAQSVSVFATHRFGRGGPTSSILSTRLATSTFSYEVSRSLAACEGALLVVDAAQGVEAQSVANCITAIDQGLEVLPVLNKIDLSGRGAGPRRKKRSRTSSASMRQNAVPVSAKTGQGVPEHCSTYLVDMKFRPPKGDPGRSSCRR